MLRPTVVFAPGNECPGVRARNLLYYWAMRELGMSMTRLAARLKASPSAVSLSVKRGEQIARFNKYQLAELPNL